MIDQHQIEQLVDSLVAGKLQPEEVISALMPDQDLEAPTTFEPKGPAAAEEAINMIRDL